MKKFSEKPTGVLSASDLKTFKGKFIYWAFMAIVIIASVLSVTPAIWTILTAFKDSQEIYTSMSFIPQNFSWEKIVSRLGESWEALQLEKSIVNTFILTIGNVVFKIVVCGFGGYVLSKLKPRGSSIIFVLTVWTMMMPSQIRMVPNYISALHFPFAYDYGIGYNMMDTFWPFWLGAGADAFALILFKNAFDGLSSSYLEAARIDGCSNYGAFFKIMLPLVTPIIIFETINTFNVAFSDFFGPLLYLDKNEVLPLTVYRLNSDPTIKQNTYFMALVLASLPSFLIFLIFQRRILGGVNVGGVKG